MVSLPPPLPKTLENRASRAFFLFFSVHKFKLTSILTFFWAALVSTHSTTPQNTHDQYGQPKFGRSVRRSVKSWYLSVNNRCVRVVSVSVMCACAYACTCVCVYVFVCVCVCVWCGVVCGVCTPPPSDHTPQVMHSPLIQDHSSADRASRIL